MNILAYTIYLLLTYLITVHVGFTFYRNGRVFIVGMLKGEEQLADVINRLLLTGYYLLNMGYAAIMLRGWQRVNSWAELVSSVGTMTGKIMLTLALIHFFNMAAVYYLGKHNLINNKV